MWLKSDKLQDYVNDYGKYVYEGDDVPYPNAPFDDAVDFVQRGLLGFDTSGKPWSSLRAVKAGLAFLLERENVQRDDSCTVEMLLEFDQRRKPEVFGSVDMANFFIYWADQNDLVDCMSSCLNSFPDQNTDYLIGLIDQALALKDESGGGRAIENTATTNQRKSEDMDGYKRGEMIVISVEKPN